MSGQCNICLSEFKDPVCIPCGHVYCSNCIWDYAGAGDNDAFTASCPTCRATFPIVLPDMRGLPKKFHTFFSPSIRRVFIETSPDFEDLKERLNASESRNAVLERDNKHLMTACERFMKQSDAHATGERRVTLDLQKLKGLLNDERRKAEETKAQLDAVQQKYDKLKLAHREQDRASAPSPPATIGVKRLRLSRSNSGSIQERSASPEVPNSTQPRILRGLPARASIAKYHFPRPPGTTPPPPQKRAWVPSAHLNSDSESESDSEASNSDSD